MSDKKVKVFFRGCSGVVDPVDCDGRPIKEGDTLTHTWFDEHGEEWCKEYNISPEKQMEPTYIVKKHESGEGLFGEGIEEKRLSEFSPPSRMYLHDFRFKETKNLSV
jgi:hypothetical protein